MVWQAKGSQINKDLKTKQTLVSNNKIPKAIVEAKTGINEVDQAIEVFYKTGYMHNHMRMYVASICCNIARSHWYYPSKWLYYHLLDGDIASNQLSWQWVAGTFSNKKYYANQDNINKFFYGSQHNTFLDIDYEDFENLKIPDILLETTLVDLNTTFPAIEKPSLDRNQKTLIYNYYNLDPNWYKDEEMQRVLLLEPSIFASYPVSSSCIEFVLELSKNIKDIKIFIGEFEEIEGSVNSENIVFKEHPLNSHYKGVEKPREWLTTIEGYYPSFFSYWKKCKKQLII